MIKKVLMVGASLQSENRGVSALTRGAINAVIDNYNDVEIQLLCYTIKKPYTHRIIKNNKTYIINEINCSPSDSVGVFLISMIKPLLPGKLFLKLSKKHRAVFDSLLGSDIVMDASEGDSFSDIYGLKRFITHSTIKISSIRLQKKIVLLPQTFGPFKRFFARKAAGYVLKRTNYNFARDMLSYNNVVDNLKVGEDKVSYIPDMSFYMEPSQDTSILPEEFFKRENDGSVLIGMNVSGLLYYGGYTGSNMFNFIVDYKELVDEIIRYFLSIKNTRILLIPHVMFEKDSVEDDLAASREVMAKLDNSFKNRVFLLDKQYREHELKSIIGQCDFFCGGRMHACIGAISMGVPAVPIAYSRKFEGVWGQLGLDHCIADLRKHNKENTIKIIDKIFNNREEVKQILDLKIANIKSEINKMFDIIYISTQ